MTQPSELAERAECAPPIDRNDGEEVRGYAVMGVPFESGHVLALRRLPSSSFGPSYTTVWLRLPSGAWTIFTNVAPEDSCPRYFGAALDRVVRCEIRVAWTEPSLLRVTIPHAGLEWELRAKATALTRSINVLAGLMPDSFWNVPAVLSVMGAASSALLRVGRVSLHGRVPNGQWFRLEPRLIFRVAESHASLAGADLGVPGRLPRQEFMGDFPITQAGLLAFGGMMGEVFDPERHTAAPSEYEFSLSE